MATFRKVRELLLTSFDDGHISEDEFLLYPLDSAINFLNNRGLLSYYTKRKTRFSPKLILLVSFSCALWSGRYLKFDSLIACFV